jgi:hypothetical protein
MNVAAVVLPYMSSCTVTFYEVYNEEWIGSDAGEDKHKLQLSKRNNDTQEDSQIFKYRCLD